MKILVAPDKFKGSLTAREAAEAIGRGLARVMSHARIELVPMADGGEGTVDAFAAAGRGAVRRTVVTGPLGDPIEAAWGIDGGTDDIKTAVIEMSAASGLRLVEGRNQALAVSTVGTGELIKAALDAGCRRIVIGIGGSATTDGGAGVAEALGARLLDAQGRLLARGGGGLIELAAIDPAELDPRLRATEVLVACDVDNPLFGPRGAAFVYGPQKGATPAEIIRLDEGLRRLAEVVERDLGVKVGGVPGGGAAGGLGAGLVAFAGARLTPGVDLVADIVGLPGRMAGADLVITGEGRVDEQTGRGKVPVGVARLAREHNTPVVAITGSIGPGAEIVYGLGIAAIEPICTHPMTLAEANKNAAALVEAAAERVLRLMLLGTP